MSLLGDHPTLHAHLVTMLRAVSITMTDEHSQRLLSDGELSVSADNLLLYLAFTITKKRRHTRTVMVPENLEFNILKGRKEEEATFDENGVKVKGERRWYYLVLCETVGGIGMGGDVEILVQGDSTLEKGKVLEEFRGTVEMQVPDWEDQFDERKRREALADLADLAAAGGA